MTEPGRRHWCADIGLQREEVRFAFVLGEPARNGCRVTDDRAAHEVLTSRLVVVKKGAPAARPIALSAKAKQTQFVFMRLFAPSLSPWRLAWARCQ